MTTSGIPVLKIANIQGKRVLEDCKDHLPEKLFEKKLAKYVLLQSDTLVAMTGAGSVGKFGKMPKIKGTYLVNQRVGIIRPNPDLADAGYLYYVLIQDRYEEQLYALGLGAGQPNVSAKQIGGLEIFLPDLTTQRKIAGILSAYDDLIENNLRRIKILEEMAQSLYREWFVHFRFPGHESAKFVDSEIGRIPKGWEVTSLGQLVDIRKGKNITKTTIREGGVPVVAGGLTPAYYHDTANTVAPAVTISASGANAGFVNIYFDDVWASDCSFIDREASPDVFYFFLLLISRQIEVTSLQRGSAQPHVYPKDLMALEAVSVPQKIRDDFTQRVTPLFESVRNLHARNQTLRRTRDLLVPQLLQCHS